MYEEGRVYHVYNRGVAKLPVFHGPDDYHDFQDILRYLLAGLPLSDSREVSQTSRYQKSGHEKLHLPISYIMLIRWGTAYFETIWNYWLFARCRIIFTCC